MKYATKNRFIRLNVLLPDFNKEHIIQNYNKLDFIFFNMLNIKKVIILLRLIIKSFKQIYWIH